MTEILYCSKKNKILLFSGQFELDIENKKLTIYLQTNGTGMRVKSISDLHHIGWL
jgi:hypothetical protein